MGMDPMCAKLNAGKRPVQEIVAATADGSLANVFVSLQGSFPATPVPSEPVTIDQRACVYVPRVVGARVDQTLQVRNSDELLHNVHGVSAHGNDFNLSQPTGRHRPAASLKNAEIMLRDHVRRAQVDDRLCRRRQPSVFRHERRCRHLHDRQRARRAPTRFRRGTSSSAWLTQTVRVTAGRRARSTLRTACSN